MGRGSGENGAAVVVLVNEYSRGLFLWIAFVGVMVLAFAIVLAVDVREALVGLIALVGVGLCVYGLYGFTYRSTTRVHTDRVVARRRVLGFACGWSEPISNYIGLLTEFDSDSARVTSAVYVLRLVHPRRDRQVVLARSETPEGVEERLPGMCRRFGLPALTRTADGFAETDAPDLGRTATQLWSEGKIEFDADALARAPLGVEVRSEGAAVEIAITRRDRPALMGMAVQFVLAAGVLYLGLRASGLYRLLMLAGVVWGVFAVGMFLDILLTAQVVRITAERVEVLTKVPLAAAGHGSVALADIENVYVGPVDTRSTRSGLLEEGLISLLFPESNAVIVVAGRKTALAMGRGLGREGLEWLRALILVRCIS